VTNKKQNKTNKEHSTFSSRATQNRAKFHVYWGNMSPREAKNPFVWTTE